MDLSVVNHEDYFAKIGDDHKFPIEKFGALANYLKKNKVVKNFYKPYPCSNETLKRAHSESYIQKVKEKTLDSNTIKKIGFPLVDSVIQRSLVATGGTVLASKLALDYKLACNTAGGSHHANFEGGAGYCVFNDVAVAAKFLKHKKLVKKILIIDLDVHQGNGSADIFKNDKDVFTFSIHSKSNYPAKKSTSNLDVELEDNIEDEQAGIFNTNLPEGEYEVYYTYTHPITQCSDTIPHNVTIHPVPDAIFAADPLGCNNSPYPFAQLTTGATSTLWDLGNGDTSNDWIPDYTYPNIGDYTVTLFASNDLGCVDTAYVDVEVTEVPIAEFIMSTDSGCAALEVDFTNISFAPYSSFEWIFADNYFFDASPATYAFQQGDSIVQYYPQLTVSNLCGFDVFIDEERLIVP